MHLATKAVPALMNDTSHTAIVELHCEHTRFDFRCYRKNMVLRRIHRRTGLQQLETPQQYIQLLKKEATEVTLFHRGLAD